MKSKVSSNRWLLAYTLMKNPQLQEWRGHYITVKRAGDTAAVEQTVMAKSDDKEMESLVKVNNEDNKGTPHELQVMNIDEGSVSDDNKTMLNSIV